MSADPEQKLVRFAFGLTLALLVVRLAVGSQVDLFFDEAYYWLWSTQLQAGYYDHPPMVALFIRAGTMVFGKTEFGVRFVSAVSVAAGMVLVYGIARTLSESRRLAASAMIFANVTAIAAISIFVVPDQPMMLFWLAAFYGLARIAKGGAPQWWLLVGLMGGLAATSKYTTFFLAAAVPLWLLAVPAMRRTLRQPWPYLGLGLGLLAFLPTLLWNAGHDWISFTFQYSRTKFPEPRLDSVVSYLALFPLMATPPILLLAIAGVRRLLRGGWRQDPARALLLLTPIPLALYFVWHALGEWIGAHWIAPLVALIAILAAYGIDDGVGKGAWALVVRVTHRLALPVGLLASLVLYVALLEPWLPIAPDDDPTARFRGWEEFAANAEAKRVATGAAYLLGADYSMPAYFRFYLDDPPPIVQLGDFERWSYFDGLGTADPALVGATGLYVGKWGVDTERAIAEQYFSDVTREGNVNRPTRPGTEAFEWPAWLVSGPKAAALPLFGLAPPGG